MTSGTTVSATKATPAKGSKLELKPVGGNFSLKEHIYEVLKNGITAMNIYDEGADLRLDERQMSEQLGISRTPIREALARLEQEGFIEIQPRRGVFIKRKSLQEILEMITVWAALESMAARLACEHASDAEIATLRSALPSYRKDELRAHIDEYSEANISFHQRILELGRCRLLKDIADGLFLHMRAIRERAMAEGDRVRRSIEDHMHIIEAIESRDAERAEKEVRHRPRAPRPRSTPRRVTSLYEEDWKERRPNHVDRHGHAAQEEPRHQRRLRRTARRQGNQERGRGHDFHALRRAHHRHL
jgi:DNA-binding GntR family transcriptional regulator